ncbi:MAG TPA: hypothetical protein VG935_03425 [Patescibacteria group bacterium]|nr:hypothetical protein [Patescibacteria group bacterium]
MRRKKRQLIYLILAVISFVSFIFIVLLVSPLKEISLGFIDISPLIIFFIPLVLFFFSLPTFIFRSKKHGVLLSLFVLVYLLMRIFGLTHPLFLVLLIGLLLTLELLFSPRQA